MAKSQPALPTSDLSQEAIHLSVNDWFEYPVKVHPHHTDYGGVVWHGTYLTWMEEARVEALRALGIEYSEIVNMGCELLVVDLSMRYHRGVRMGEEILIRTRLVDMQGVRINWVYELQSLDRTTLHVTANVTLVAVDRENGKIMRRLPPAVKSILTKRPV
ncbi:acyl-CoA thioesterase [Alkalinema pantanalense CENA528]|uniref:acyl-CoA thioesterase n=1 Tax=Alkalinema pantanalense TaxID=1620705 RepID=UPI003D6E87B6